MTDYEQALEWLAPRAVVPVRRERNDTRARWLGATTFIVMSYIIFVNPRS